MKVATYNKRVPDLDREQHLKAEHEAFSTASAKLTKSDRNISEENKDIFEP